MKKIRTINICIITLLILTLKLTTTLASNPIEASTLKSQKPECKQLCMGVNTSYKLKMHPAKSLKYFSTNSKIAKVNNKGLITANKPGNCKINIVDKRNKKISIKLKVLKKFKKVSLITLQTNNTVLYFNGSKSEQTLSLTPKYKPVKATIKKCIYVSSNSKVAKVSKKGVVTAVSEGNVSIIAYAADGRGSKAICKISVKNKHPENITAVATSNPTPGIASVKPTPLATATNIPNIVFTGTANHDIVIDNTNNTALSVIKGDTVQLGIYAHSIKPSFKVSALKITTSAGNQDIKITNKNVGAIDASASVINNKAELSSTHNYHGMLTILYTLPSGLSASDITNISFTTESSSVLSYRLYAGEPYVSYSEMNIIQ